MIKPERTAMIKEGIGASIHDAHDDDFMIEIKRSPADRPNRIPEWWQIAHEISLKQKIVWLELGAHLEAALSFDCRVPQLTPGGAEWSAPLASAR